MVFFLLIFHKLHSRYFASSKKKIVNVIFLELKAHESIMGLLIHENTDITCDAIELIKELTEVDENSPDSIDAVKLLVQTLV